MKIVTPEEMGDIEAQSMVQGVSNAALLHNEGIGVEARPRGHIGALRALPN